MCFFLSLYSVVFQPKWMLSIRVMMLERKKKKVAVLLLSTRKTTSRKLLLTQSQNTIYKIVVCFRYNFGLSTFSLSLSIHSPTHVCSSDVDCVRFHYRTTNINIVALECCNTTEFRVLAAFVFQLYSSVYPLVECWMIRLFCLALQFNRANELILIHCLNEMDSNQFLNTFINGCQFLVTHSF